MDYFAKWPEAYAIPNKDASTVAKGQVTGFFCLLKVPWEQHSEQGCNFESCLIQEVLQCLVVTLQLRDWDAGLLIFLLAYCASTHDTTGLTPG
jgi:hypothetical protein